MSLVDIDWAGRPVRIEHTFVGEGDGPLLVFLHEGLGSLAMWKDFPARLCAAAGCRGLVYSRPGYGQSTPRAPDESWGVDFMHRQAFELLPALLRALGVGEPYWLFGHSDGGSIALLHAARFADQVVGAIVLAPHIFVEDLSVASIEQARFAYEQGDLKQGLAKYHADPDSAFWGWNRIWLDPAFRRWRIGPAIQSLRCPLLAVQGIDDEYGTLEQIRGIKRLAPHTQLLELPACGHSPHRDQPETLIEAAKAFLHTHGDER
jgi:pimeloyl-ACP methyl ester carboxylesterase